MLGAVHGDLLARPWEHELTGAELRERERHRETIRRLLEDIAEPCADDPDLQDAA